MRSHAILLMTLMFAVGGSVAEATTTVYLAIRGDGQPGGGTTEADPYDASVVDGVSRFDEHMRSFGPDTIVNLAPGLYRTWGDDGMDLTHPGRGRGFYIKSGMQLIGAGQGKTVIQLMGLDLYPNAATMRTVVSSGPDGSMAASTPGAVVQNLTVDCNSMNLIPTVPASADNLFYKNKNISQSGVKLYGDGVQILNVEVINAYGWLGPPKVEGWGIVIGGAHGASASGALVDHCKVWKSVGDYSGGIFATTSFDGLLTATVQNSYVYGLDWFGYGVAGNTTAVSFLSNVADLVRYGFYWDTQGIKELHFTYNTFVGNESAARFNSVDASGVPIEFLQDVEFETNYLETKTGGFGNDVVRLDKNISVPTSVFSGVTFNSNTFVNSSPTSVGAVGVASDMVSLYRDIRLKSNTLIGALTEIVPGAPTTNVTDNSPFPGSTPNLSLSVTPTNSTVMVGTSVTILAQADHGSSPAVTGINIPANASQIYVGSANLAVGWTPTLDQVGVQTMGFYALNAPSNRLSVYKVASVTVLPNPMIASVAWKNVTGLMEVTQFPGGSRIQKVVTTAPDTSLASAESVGRIIGDGWVEFHVGKAPKDMTFQIGNGTSGDVYPAVTVQISSGMASVSLVNVAGFPPASQSVSDNGAVFRIERSPGYLKYYVNGVLKSTWTNTYYRPLGLKVSTTAPGAYMDGCVFNGARETEPITWTSLTNMSVASTPTEGSMIQKTGSAGWNSMAIGTKKIVGDGCVQFRFNQANADMLVSLSNWNGSTDPQNQQFAIYAKSILGGLGGQVHIVEKPNLDRLTVSYTNADIFRIERKGTTISYYQNNTLLYTSPIQESLPLVVNCAGNQVGASVRDCTYSGATQVEPLTDWNPNPDVTLNVAVAEADPTGQDLGGKIVTTVGGWTNHASSTKQILGDGAVQFRFLQSDQPAYVSLSCVNQISNMPQFAILATPSAVSLIEYPSQTRMTVAYTTADLFRMERRNGEVSFYKNGQLLYTPIHRELRPLIVGFAGQEAGAGVTNISYSGAQGAWFADGGNMTTIYPTGETGAKIQKSDGATSTLGSTWNGYTSSTKTISADGSVQFQFGQDDADILVSLSKWSGSADQNHQQFAFRGNSADKTVSIVDYAGGPVPAPMTYKTGDVFKIERTSNVIKFYKNGGSPIYTSSNTESLPLTVTCAANQVGAFVNNVVYTGAP